MRLFFCSFFNTQATCVIISRIKLFLLTNAQQTSTTRQLPLGAIEKSGLARLLGVDRTTLYRELKTLSEHGVIETVDNVIYLKDRSFLEE